MNAFVYTIGFLIIFKSEAYVLLQIRTQDANHSKVDALIHRVIPTSNVLHQLTRNIARQQSVGNASIDSLFNKIKTKPKERQSISTDMHQPKWKKNTFSPPASANKKTLKDSDLSIKALEESTPNMFGWNVSDWFSSKKPIPRNKTSIDSLLSKIKTKPKEQQIISADIYQPDWKKVTFSPPASGNKKTKQDSDLPIKALEESTLNKFSWNDNDRFSSKKIKRRNNTSVDPLLNKSKTKTKEQQIISTDIYQPVWEKVTFSPPALGNKKKKHNADLPMKTLEKIRPNTFTPNDNDQLSSKERKNRNSSIAPLLDKIITNPKELQIISTDSYQPDWKIDVFPPPVSVNEKTQEDTDVPNAAGMRPMFRSNDNNRLSSKKRKHKPQTLHLRSGPSSIYKISPESVEGAVRDILSSSALSQYVASLSKKAAAAYRSVQRDLLAENKPLIVF